MDQCVITRTSTVASGRFAPGHLGELTQQIPFEMVDAALAATGRLQARVRALPARVVVYLVLAGCLFAELGYGQVWQRLAAGLQGLPVVAPTASALTQARRRLGSAPFQALFALLAGPGGAGPAAVGVRVGGLLVCAIDGTTMSVADTPANLTTFAKQPGHHGGSGYPLVRLVALVACGTRTVIDAVFGPIATGELAYAGRLCAGLRAGMLVLADRNFDSAGLIGALAASGAQLLIRCKTGTTARRLPLLGCLPDGSWLSLVGGVKVRVLHAQITIATATGERTGDYRLVTTLLDARAWPAAMLVALYHQRWEIEMCQPRCTHGCEVAA